MVDWYNTNREWDTNKLYLSYKEMYTDGISQKDASYFKKAFKHHRQESKYYNMTMSHNVGQFTMIAKKYQPITIP